MVNLTNIMYKTKQNYLPYSETISIIQNCLEFFDVFERKYDNELGAYYHNLYYKYYMPKILHQKNDLQRQISFMQTKFPNSPVWHDIGSGINWKRKNFNKLLEQAKNGLIETIVVAHKDRLCRFAFELVENVFRQFNTKILVLNKEVDSTESEFVEDIISFLQVYIAKANGKRRYGKTKKK